MLHSVNTVWVTMKRDLDGRMNVPCGCASEVMCLMNQVHALRDDLRKLEKRAASEVGSLWTRVKELEAENSNLKARSEGYFPHGFNSFMERVGTLNTQMFDLREDVESAATYATESKQTTLQLCERTNAILEHLSKRTDDLKMEPVQWETSEGSQASSSSTDRW